MNRVSKMLLWSILSLGFATGLAGCQQEGPAEKAGEKVGKAAEEAGRKIDETAEKTGEKMEEAKETLSETATRAGTYMDDATITAKIKADLLSDSLLKAARIDVTTTNGVVKLAGVVDSQEGLERSIEIARSVEGVSSVESELVVKTAQ